jgi:hypothetical protein
VTTALPPIIVSHLEKATTDNGFDRRPRIPPILVEKL